MRSRREQRSLRRLDQQLLDLRLRLEHGIGKCIHQVRKRVRNRLSWLAIGHDRSELQLRMPGNQAQQLAGHIAGATENDCWNRRAHDATPAFTPIASITRSPSAAPSVIALNAATPIWVLMMSTPTALSVAGPVTTQGSTPKRSRNSFTPPQAATGSFAERMTPVSAARMSGHSRMASTPYVPRMPSPS